MTGTLFVRADGTSCGASMVKRSVDFASEALRCQRISSITPQITFDQGVIGGFSQGALGARFIRAATGRPKCPPVISKFAEKPRRILLAQDNDARAPRNDGLGGCGHNYDGWEAVTPWASLELSFELLAFF